MAFCSPSRKAFILSNEMPYVPPAASCAGLAGDEPPDGEPPQAARSSVAASAAAPNAFFLRLIGMFPFVVEKFIVLPRRRPRAPDLWQAVSGWLAESCLTSSVSVS